MPWAVTLAIVPTRDGGRTLESVAPESNLNFLRATAVLLVFAGHLLHTFGFLPEYVIRAAHWGVLVFFVHTALVLMLSLERLAKSRPHEEFLDTVYAFYVRRAWRIYPLAILCILLVSCCGIPRDSWGGPVIIGASKPLLYQFGLLLANLTLTQNISGVQLLSAPLWSLPYEVQMYLLLPFFFHFLQGRRWPHAALLWLAGLLSAIIGPVRLTFYFPCFLSGVLAYGLLRDSTFRHAPVQQAPVRHDPIWRLPAWAWPLAVLLHLTLFATFPFGLLNREDWPFALLLGMMIPQFAPLQPGWFSGAARQIAKYSYGIYLSHVPLLWLCFVHLSPLALAARWGLFVLLMVAVPVLSYHFIEAPAIRAGLLITGRRRSRVLPDGSQPQPLPRLF